MGCGSSKVECSVISMQGFPKNNVKGHNNGTVVADNVVTSPTPSVRVMSPVPGVSFKKLRTELCGEIDAFVHVDKMAAVVPTTSLSVKQLAEYFNQIADDEILKVRSIWIWITMNIQNDNSADSAIDKDSINLDNVIFEHKSNAVGFAGLFKALCENCNIKCETILGWCKSYYNGTCTKLKDEPTNHAWNTVYLNDKWWLMDTYWGAGYCDDNQNFIQAYNENNFLIDPNNIILDRFPVKKKWQLLKTPITLETFEKRLHFSRYFSELQMRPLTHENSNIACDANKLNIKFKINKEQPVVYTGILTSSDSVETEPKNVNIYTTEKILHIRLLIPVEDTLTLKLYAQNTTTMNQKQHLCTYIIQSTFNNKEGGSSVNSAFPKQHKKYLPGFYLFSPTEGDLIVGRTYCFKISLPGATEMAVCIGGSQSSWFPVSNVRGTLWESDIVIPKGSERVTVVCKFSNHTNTTFTSVLEYQVALSG